MHLIVGAVMHLRYLNGVATLKVPGWPSASFVKELVVLSRQVDLLIECPGQRMEPHRKPSVFLRGPSFNMLAGLLRFCHTLSLVSICTFFLSSSRGFCFYTTFCGISVYDHFKLSEVFGFVYLPF